ncbi:unnamed protein product, partial [marine sediment metagenome]
HGLKAGGQKRRCVDIHAAAGGGAGRTNNLARPGWRRPHIIKCLSLKVKWGFISSIQCLKEPAVGGITGGVDHPGNKNPGAHGQLLYYLWLNW